jgi:hypothetical protein
MVTPHIESVTGSIASFNSDYNKIPVKSLICDIEPIQEGEGNPSPENIRPISGRTGLSVVRTGKNLYGRNTGKYNEPVYATDGSSLPYEDVNVVWIKVKPNTTYLSHLYLNGEKPAYMRWIECDKYKRFIWRDPAQNTKTAPIITRTTKSNTEWIQAAANQFPVGELYKNVWEAVISEDLSITDYEPYKGSTYSVNWETDAGTVYGGALDIVSGKLTVDRAIETITKDSNWYSFSTGSGNSSAVVQLANIPLYVTGSSNKNGSICSSGLELQNYWTSARQNESGITDNGYAYTQTGVLRFHRLDTSTITTLAEFKSAFPDTQVCYKLATPIEIQLTPQEIRTLLGLNNIWCDSGNVTVDYWKWGK